MIAILLLVLGLALLIKGADWLVEGAASLARKFRIPELVIGLTIVAFGTSAPELIVNTFAAFEGSYDIVLGNIIGSNNFNLFIILGISSLITPLVVQSNIVWKEIPFSFLAAVILFILGNDYLFADNAPASLSRVDGLMLLAAFVLFLFYIYKNLKKEPEKKSEENKLSNIKITLFIIVGLAALIFGGRLVVNNAIIIAQALEISEKVIGLTIVAAGTSLPELATSLVAAAKKNNDIAVGNVIGSNIFNIS